MKLIIKTQLKAEFSCDPSSTQSDIADTAADFTDIAEICNRFFISHEIIVGTEIGSLTKITIHAQKLIIGSKDVNEFLNSVLYLFDYTLDYVPAPHELTLEIIEKKL